MSCFQLRKVLEQIISDENELERELGMQLLIARRDVFDRRDHRLQLFLRLFELG